jgi:sec-independent protein translocase protein TatA
MGNIGPGQLLIIALVLLLIFGAGRVAEIGKGLGAGIKNFKKGLQESDDEPPQLPPRESSSKSG